MSFGEKKTVAVVGADSAVGGEFLRLALGHPNLEVTAAASERYAGEPVSIALPHLRGQSHLTFIRKAEVEKADILVVAPQAEVSATDLAQFEASAEVLMNLCHASTAGPTAENPQRWVYGLPEIRRDELRGATHICMPGSFATSVILPLYPLLQMGVLQPRDIVVTGMLGSSAVESVAVVSDSPQQNVTHYLVGHPQLAEIQQALPGKFPLHLTTVASPRPRGILTTLQAWIPDGWSQRDVWTAYRDIYAAEPFVRVIRESGGPRTVPDPTLLDGTNFCDIAFEMDDDTGRLVVLTALDNLVKGGAGQAIQGLNVAQGWPEEAGLTFTGLYPA